jgi:hypothetical protein
LQSKILQPPQKGQSNFFNRPSLWQLKIFLVFHKGGDQNGTRCGNQKKLSPSYHHYFLNGDRIISIATKGRLSFFLENSCQKSLRGSKKKVASPLFW